jgi:hypothetical protein
VATWSLLVPLTLSHPAMVLPLRRLGLPVTALGAAAVAVVVVIGACAGLATAVASAPGLHAMAFKGVVNAIIAVVVSTTAVCVAWRAVGPSAE